MAAKAGFSTASTATLSDEDEDQPVGVLAQRSQNTSSAKITTGIRYSVK